MTRFSLKNLLLATTLVSDGMGLIYFANQHPNLNGDETWELIIGWFGGGAFVGAALTTPFKRPWTGAIIVVVMQLLLGIA